MLAELTGSTSEDPHRQRAPTAYRPAAPHERQDRGGYPNGPFETNRIVRRRAIRRPTHHSHGRNRRGRGRLFGALPLIPISRALAADGIFNTVREDSRHHLNHEILRTLLAFVQPLPLDAYVAISRGRYEDVSAWWRFTRLERRHAGKSTESLCLCQSFDRHGGARMDSSSDYDEFDDPVSDTTQPTVLTPRAPVSTDSQERWRDCECRRSVRRTHHDCRANS